MILKELKKCIFSRELISIERSSITEVELTGHPVFANESVVVVQIFNNDGINDGFSVFETETISEIFWGNREHLAISKLIAQKNQPLKTLSFDLTFNNLDEALITLSDRYIFLEIYCEFFNETGFDIVKILEFDDEWIKVESLGTKKTLSQLTRLVRRENITKIHFDTPYLNDIMSLSLNA